MRVTIFYSWQSDLPNNTNRGLIERALQKAIDAIKADAETVLEPCMERDTAGVPGTPDIASTIFRKIDECQVFVGDVSIINANSPDRKTPNPNVVLELGYAARAVTWDNVVCVFNTAYGDVGDLPFDLRLRRMCTYAVTAEQAAKADERDKLAAKFKEALAPVLKRFAAKVQEDTAPKPPTPQSVAAQVKEYLADDRHRIALTDLVLSQGGDLSRLIVGSEFTVGMNTRLTHEDVWERVKRYEEGSRVAGAVMATGCYYGTDDQSDWWCQLLQAAGNPGGDGNGYTSLLDLRRYPALLLLYAGGVAATAAGRYGTLLALLTRPNLQSSRNEQDQPQLVALTPYRVLDGELVMAMLKQRLYSPQSEHFFRLFRDPLRPFLADERQYERTFDRFEYLRCLLEVDQTGSPQSMGRFGWRWRFQQDDVRKAVEEEEARSGLAWPPYKAGWFSGQPAKFKAAKKAVDDQVTRLSWH